jgi:hypothetical protein
MQWGMDMCGLEKIHLSSNGLSIAGISHKRTQLNL